MRGFLFCLIFVSLNLQAQDAVSPDGGRYYGPVRGGIPHGSGRYVAPSGETYEGEFRNGELTGSGTYTRRDGARYSGEFRNWKPHGKGRFVEPGGAPTRRTSGWKPPPSSSRPTARSSWTGSRNPRWTPSMPSAT